MITDITPCGILAGDCSLPGETRNDDRFVGLLNGIQVGRDRFVLVFTTRGFRGTDDNCSVVYQLRDGDYDGRIIKEGMLAQAVDDWDVLETGRLCCRTHLCPAPFGVPKGAVIDGKPAPSANVFAVTWERKARFIDPDTGFMLNTRETDPWLHASSVAIEWLQFRLNDDDDDIEIIQPKAVMRQKGFQCAYAFCNADVHQMMQPAGAPLPYNDDGTQWVGSGFFDTHFAGRGRIAALLFTFNPESGLYEWTRTSPILCNGVIEPSLARLNDTWIISARQIASMKAAWGGPVAWMQTNDLFGDPPNVTTPSEPLTTSPVLITTGADGGLRLFTNDANISPYDHPRDPLYCWDIDPDRDFIAEHRRVVFDSRKAGVPIKRESGIAVDNGKLLPHAGGDTQILAHRVRPVATNDPRKLGVPVTGQCKRAAGIYYAKVRYDEACDGLWRFC